MKQNYESIYHVAMNGKIHNVETGEKVHQYVSYVNEHCTRIKLNGKPYQKRTQLIVARIYLNNPHNYNVLYVKDHSKVDLKDMYWCTTAYLMMARENDKLGIETPPQTPESKITSRKRAASPPAFTPHSNKPIPHVKPNIASNVKWS